MSAARIRELSQAASDYVRRSVGVLPELEPASLAYVDHYLAQVDQVQDDVLGLVASAVGTWFGELLAAQLGGRWRAVGDDPAGWAIDFVGPDERPLLWLHPVSLAATALRRGEVDGYDASLHPPPELSGRVGELLAAALPVDESYFYSLTGRYEAIEQILELLAELRLTTPGRN